MYNELVTAHAACEVTPENGSNKARNMNAQVIPMVAPAAAQAPAVTGTYNTAATSRGGTNGRLSSQWWSRPDDQRFLSLTDLLAHVQGEADASSAQVIDASKIKVQASRDNAERLTMILPDDTEAAPTHWSFGQTCSLVGAPAGYLRKLPAALAGINLQYGLSTFRQELVKTYTRTDGTAELRAMTGADYGRIHDHELVRAIMKFAGNGTGDTHWKVPGMLDWGSQRGGVVKYNPFVDITKQTTTLFASDRDVFCFLVDDTHPIEIGKLPNGDPDLVFRGFYAWNSEVGSKTAGVATMYLRGVCCNRMLWGVENFQEISIRHTKNAPMRFLEEAAPALETYAQASTMKLVEGVKAAREALVARDQDDRETFLGKAGFNAKQVDRIIQAVCDEEGKQPESVWDFVQGITAVARTLPHQDARIELERKAGKLLDKVA